MIQPVASRFLSAIPRNRNPFLLLSLLALTPAALTPAALAASTPAPTFNVRDFGALGDGHTHDTFAIVRAIEAASQQSGIVLFPPGTYLTGTVELRSHITLDLQAGAVLEGSPNPSDYGSSSTFGFDHNYGTSSSGEGDRVGMLVARDVEDITIQGDGAIDGNGDSFFDIKQPHMTLDFDPAAARNPDAILADLRRTDDGPIEVSAPGRPGTLIIFSHCRHITIQGVAIRNAPNWSLHFQHAQGITVSHLRLENNPHLPNNDGLDCMDCHNVHVSDSDFSAGDDDFAFVGSDDVTVANCTLRSYSAAIRLEDTRNSIFTNLILHTNRGIAIFARANSHTYNVLFSNLVIETHLLHGHWWGKGEPIYLAASANASPNSIHDLRFTNIIADAEAGILLDARSPGVVSNITLRDVTLNLHAPRPDLADAQGGNFDLRWTATNRSEAVFRHDIPGLYSHNIATLTLDGFELHWPDSPPTYFSNALQIEDFSHVDISRFTGGPAPGATLPAIDLRRGTSLSLRDSTAQPGTSTFLSLQQVSGPVFYSGNNLSAAAHKTLPHHTQSLRSHPLKHP